MVGELRPFFQSIPDTCGHCGQIPHHKQLAQDRTTGRIAWLCIGCAQELQRRDAAERKAKDPPPPKARL